MQIVRAEADEWERIREIRLRSLREDPDAFGSTLEREAGHGEDAWRAFVTGRVTGREEGVRQAAFVAVDHDGRWVGLAVGVVRPDDRSLAKLYAMWVDPVARGRGAGERLVESVASWATATGADRLELCVTEANAPAVRLYRRTGFEPTGDRDELRPGSGVATVTLRRRLALAPEVVDALVAEQIAYYDRRAPTYEQLYRREGAHDGGPEFNARWFRETADLEASVPDATGASVLELACGTGLWTRYLARTARRLVAVDASAAMLARNREAVADPTVEYVEADVFAWEPPPHQRFDLVAFGFFLSHVPPDRFDAFWARVRSWLEPGGRVWFCDDVAGPDRPYSGETVPGVPIANIRHLDGEGEFEIVKVFWHPDDLAAKLGDLGWLASVRSTGEFFLVGDASPVEPGVRAGPDGHG